MVPLQHHNPNNLYNPSKQDQQKKRKALREEIEEAEDPDKFAREQDELSEEMKKRGKGKGKGKRPRKSQNEAEDVMKKPSKRQVEAEKDDQMKRRKKNQDPAVKNLNPDFERAADDDEVKDTEKAKEVKDTEKAKEVKEAKEVKDTKKAKEVKDTKKAAKEAKEAKEVKDTKKAKEVKEAKEVKDTKKAKEVKEAKEVKDTKKAKEDEDGKKKPAKMSPRKLKKKTERVHDQIIPKQYVHVHNVCHMYIYTHSMINANDRVKIRKMKGFFYIETNALAWSGVWQERFPTSVEVRSHVQRVGKPHWWHSEVKSSAVGVTAKGLLRRDYYTAKGLDYYTAKGLLLRRDYYCQGTTTVKGLLLLIQKYFPKFKSLHCLDLSQNDWPLVVVWGLSACVLLLLWKIPRWLRMENFHRLSPNDVGVVLVCGIDPLNHPWS